MRSLVSRLMVIALFLISAPVLALAQVSPVDQELLRQQERERALRQQQEASPSVQRQTPANEDGRLPFNETSCSTIRSLNLQGDEERRFAWALNAANTKEDPALGRCLGATGIALLITRVQNAILQRGFITTRVLAAPQDLKSGILTLTLLPGRIRQIRFAAGSDTRATAWNAVPAQPGDLLNLRDIEQALENFKRVPSAEADIQITPATGDAAQPGDSDIVILWKQGFPLRLNLAIDNAGTEATGKYQTAITLSYDNWWTLNDLFYLSVNQDAGGGSSGKRGTQGHTVHYAVPWRDWLFSVTSSSNKYHQSIAGIAQNYTYNGESDNSELRIARLLYRDAVRKTNIAVRLWTRESQNFIDDAEVLVQRRHTSGWELGLSHHEVIATATLDANLAWRRGTGAFNATPAPEQAFGEGTSRMQVINADALLMLPFAIQSQRLRYSAGWRAQWNRTPLTPQDRFAIGSRYTVRGFDGEVLLTGDRGWLVRQEIALALPLAANELYGGIDTGAVGGPSSANLPGTRLTGAVVGLRGSYGKAYWDVFAGHPITKPQTFRSSGALAGFLLSLSF